MVPMDSLDPETVRFIQEAPFKHYYLWRVVNKEDSLSTPVRLVVDPTMSGLNCVLAKGENRIGSLLDIILRNRAFTYAWSSDVTKLYNQLHLERSALPYSLFLYSEELDPTKTPATLVMQRASPPIGFCSQSNGNCCMFSSIIQEFLENEVSSSGHKL